MKKDVPSLFAFQFAKTPTAAPLPGAYDPVSELWIGGDSSPVAGIFMTSIICEGCTGGVTWEVATIGGDTHTEHGPEDNDVSYEMDNC
jgi:hypothetical protein